MGLHSFLVMATPRKDNKRCHLTTGQTPNEKKRNRPRGHIQEHISSRKSLDYDSVEQTNKSPSPCIRGVLQRSIVVTSRSPRKCLVKKYPWSDAEDRATVQFIAMHKDEQATDNEWPAMRSEAEYWSLAARYMKSSTGVQYLRKGRIPSAWVAKPCHSTTGQRTTDSKKDILIHLMSSLVRWTMNKVMKVLKKMGLQILCVYTGSWGTKGKVWHTLSLVEHSYQQGMIVQLGNSITALGRVFLPPLVFCFPSRRKTNDYNVYYSFVMTVQSFMAKPQ